MQNGGGAMLCVESAFFFVHVSETQIRPFMLIKSVCACLLACVSEIFFMYV